MDKTPVIELKNVSVAFGEKKIFAKVNLSIPQGQSVAIIGPSGSGKTVLLKTMAGVIPPSTGQVLVEGEDWRALESEEKHQLASRLGMLFQRDALFDNMTLLENVAFPMREHHMMSEREILKRSEELLGMVNLGEKKDKYPYELSGGMQKRLGIARALALSPKIVFYDDPVAGQDPVQSDQVANLIWDLKKKYNSTLIFVSSKMEFAYTLAERIFMVVEEEVLDLGSPEQTQNHPDPRVQQYINGRLEGPLQLKNI
ncbi:MAG: ATP-binding cassette domain-containing protein [Bdellovibrionales bacterium]|nr:ATP-binding cassette domain-containing protein [Bdellovibrionales bacterium]